MVLQWISLSHHSEKVPGFPPLSKNPYYRLTGDSKLSHRVWLRAYFCGVLFPIDGLIPDLRDRLGNLERKSSENEWMNNLTPPTLIITNGKLTYVLIQVTHNWKSGVVTRLCGAVWLKCTTGLPGTDGIGTVGIQTLNIIYAQQRQPIRAIWEPSVKTS